MNKWTQEQLRSLAEAQNLIRQVEGEISATLPTERTTANFNSLTRDQIYDSQRESALNEIAAKLNHLLNCDSL